METIAMPENVQRPRRLVLKLNQQQLELLDRTLARGIAATREDLIRLALREYAAHHNEAAP